MPSTQQLLTWAEVAAAVALLYLRFLCYPNEELKLQSYVLELWKRVTRVAKTLNELATRFLRETAQVTLRGFDGVFGTSGFSLQAVAASYNYSAASFFLYVALGSEFDWPRELSLGATLIFLFAGTAPAFMRAKWVSLVAMIPFTSAAALTLMNVSSGSDGILLSVGMLFTWLVVVPTIDLGWLAFYRFALRWSLTRPGYMANAAVIFAGSLFSTFTIGLSEWIVCCMPSNLLEDYPFEFTILWMLLGTRLYIFGVSMLQTFILFLTLAHRPFLGVIRRILFKAQQHKVFLERPHFGKIGSVLLLHATGGVGWMRSVVQLVREFSG
jgi:hypothetical protein